MNLLGNGLSAAKHDEEALSLKETELALMRRIGDSESNILIAQGNLASTYEDHGQLERALNLQRDVYVGFLKLYGKERTETLRVANNYADLLHNLNRFEEAKSLLRKTIPAARRVLGESNDVTLRMRWNYADVLYQDPGATLDDLREAVTTLEDVALIARRVLGGAHPVTVGIEKSLQNAQAALRARETPPERADAPDARGD